MDRLLHSIEPIDALAQGRHDGTQLADLVAKPAHVLRERRGLTEIADHFATAAPQTTVELAIDHALQRRDRRRVTDDAQRLDRRRLHAEVAVGEQQLDPLPGVARLAVAP
ncbi:MAG TPA: hypothetical protein VLT45_15860, partial [Kofleriaceae bacterium]|nr:hypothetical protein [Kofleriaceae bacterium]